MCYYSRRSPHQTRRTLWRFEMRTGSGKCNQRLAISTWLHPYIAATEGLAIVVINAKLHRIINTRILACLSLEAFVNTHWKRDIAQPRVRCGQ